MESTLFKLWPAVQPTAQDALDATAGAVTRVFLASIISANMDTAISAGVLVAGENSTQNITDSESHMLFSLIRR